MSFEKISLQEFRPAAAFKVMGQDALTFLQGQFSNELRQPVGAAIYGLWLNQKGKVVADSHVLRQGENDFVLVSVASAADVIKKRLEDYIVADDIALTDVTADCHGVALVGAGSGAVLQEVAGIVPAPGKFVEAGGAWIFSGRRGATENFEMIGPEATVAGWKKKLLERGVAQSDPAVAEFARIAAGIPLVPTDIGPADLPNEGGLDDAAISYTKGCYLGQEVMARLKNLGQVRRRLVVVRGRGALPAMHAALFQGQSRVGEIRSRAGAGEDFVALAMLSLVKLDHHAGLSLAPDTPPTLTIDSRE